MEEVFRQFAAWVALGVEGAAIVLILYGALEALYGTALVITADRSEIGGRRKVWVRFGMWLMLGLEFELAADIVRSAISPSWNDIGQLAAIGLIRTFLNHFLEKDLETVNRENSRQSA